MSCAFLFFGEFGWLLTLIDVSFFLCVLSDYENYYPNGKKGAPKGDGSNKDSKRKLLPFSCASLVLFRMVI